MAAILKIIDEVTVIKIELGTYIITIPKDAAPVLEIDDSRGILIIRAASLTQPVKLKLANVTDPVVASLEELRLAIVNMLATGGGSSSLAFMVVIQDLNTGDNTINHGLDKTILHFSVKEGSNFVQVDGNIVDSDNFNINLPGGNIVGAITTFIYSL